jgi:hypothetical protein
MTGSVQRQSLIIKHSTNGRVRSAESLTDKTNLHSGYSKAYPIITRPKSTVEELSPSWRSLQHLDGSHFVASCNNHFILTSASLCENLDVFFD